MWYDIFFTNFAAVVVFVLVLVMVFRAISRPANLPPGPKPWPIIGNLPSLRGNLLKALEDLRQEYGDVYTLNLGSRPAVFVNGLKYIREMLVTRGEEFADRPKLVLTEHLAGGKGLASSSGIIWKDQRRFTLHTLRNFGFGKSGLEGKVMEEVEVLIQCLKDKCGSTFPIAKLINISVSNIICSLLFGHRFEHEDQKFVQYMKAFEEYLKDADFSGPLNYLPFLKHLPGDLFNFHKMMNHIRLLDGCIRDEINSHRETINPDEPRDFLDAYLIEIEKSQAADPSSTFEEEQLLKVTLDLFAAGSETTATTLLWALLYLINYPDVQTKLRAEIHSVVGRDRLPSIRDRKNMPYMEATLMEIQRCGDIVPLSVPHAASQDTSLSGYTIPKGTTVIPVLSSLLKDPNIWKDPEVFNPGRFLNTNGTVTNSEFLMPFSAGTRVCIGESFARMELFLFLTSMSQRFVFKAPDGMTSLPEDRIIGITQTPISYNLRAVVDV